MADDILFDILASSRLHNITGVLLYGEGSFIQVLEGGDDEVDTIFEKMEQDIRHKNIIVMINDAVEQRNFPNWATGFTSISNDRSCKFIDGLTTTDKILAQTGDHAAMMMLKAFIESNKLIIKN